MAFVRFVSGNKTRRRAADNFSTAKLQQKNRMTTSFLKKFQISIFPPASGISVDGLFLNLDTGFDGENFFTITKIETALFTRKSRKILVNRHMFIFFNKN